MAKKIMAIKTVRLKARLMGEGLLNWRENHLVMLENILIILYTTDLAHRSSRLFLTIITGRYNIFSEQ